MFLAPPSPQPVPLCVTFDISALVCTFSLKQNCTYTQPIYNNCTCCSRYCCCCCCYCYCRREKGRLDFSTPAGRHLYILFGFVSTGCREPLAAPPTIESACGCVRLRLTSINVSPTSIHHIDWLAPPNPPSVRPFRLIYGGNAPRLRWRWESVWSMLIRFADSSIGSQMNRLKTNRLNRFALTTTSFRNISPEDLCSYLSHSRVRHGFQITFPCFFLARPPLQPFPVPVRKNWPQGP